MAVDVERRNEMNLRCGKCGYVWVGCYLPMEAGKFAKMMRKAMCPSCGADSKNIFCADSSLTQEPARDV